MQEALFAQEEYVTICNTVEKYEDTIDDHLFPVDWCVPCIMHLHNRVVEKIIAMLVKMGYSKQASREEKGAYINAIENTMTTCVLRLEYNKTN